MTGRRTLNGSNRSTTISASTPPIAKRAGGGTGDLKSPNVAAAPAANASANSASNIRFMRRLVLHHPRCAAHGSNVCELGAPHIGAGLRNKQQPRNEM